MVAYRPHKPKVAGSNPASAPITRQPLPASASNMVGILRTVKPMFVKGGLDSWPVLILP